MRIARYSPPDLYKGAKNLNNEGKTAELTTRWGLIEGEWIQDLETSPYDGIKTGKARYPLQDIVIHSPVLPKKIIAVGLNYEGHIKEMGHDTPDEPLIFLKATSTVIGTGEEIVLPPESERVDYEGELGIVIGSRCRRVSRASAKEVILGYTILNDVTARDIQRKDVQFSRGKSFDTFCPIGPWIETDLDPTNVKITTVVNSELCQDDNTRSMIFDPFYLVEFINAVMTLEAGDIIATGTPSGVGPLKDGDNVSVAIEGIGVLTNPVVKESVGEPMAGDGPFDRAQGRQ